MPKAASPQPGHNKTQKAADAAFDALGIQRNDIRIRSHVTRTVREAYDEVAPVNLRSSIHRTKLKQSIRDHLDDLPQGFERTKRSDLVEKLYVLARAMHSIWDNPTAGIRDVSESPAPATPAPAPAPARKEPFDYTRESVLSNLELGALRVLSSREAVTWNLSDFIPAKDVKKACSPDGTWVDCNYFSMDMLRQKLREFKYLKSDRDTLWLYGVPLDHLSPRKLDDWPHESELPVLDDDLPALLREFVDSTYRHLSISNLKMLMRDGGDYRMMHHSMLRPGFTLVVRTKNARKHTEEDPDPKVIARRERERKLAEEREAAIARGEIKHPARRDPNRIYPPIQVEKRGSKASRKRKREEASARGERYKDSDKSYVTYKASAEGPDHPSKRKDYRDSSSRPRVEMKHLVERLGKMKREAYTNNGNYPNLVEYSSSLLERLVDETDLAEEEGRPIGFLNPLVACIEVARHLLEGTIEMAKEATEETEFAVSWLVKIADGIITTICPRPDGFVYKSNGKKHDYTLKGTFADLAWMASYLMMGLRKALRDNIDDNIYDLSVQGEIVTSTIKRIVTIVKEAHDVSYPFILVAFYIAGELTQIHEEDNVSGTLAPLFETAKSLKTLLRKLPEGADDMKALSQPANSLFLLMLSSVIKGFEDDTAEEKLDVRLKDISNMIKLFHVYNIEGLAKEIAADTGPPFLDGISGFDHILDELTRSFINDESPDAKDLAAIQRPDNGFPVLDMAVLFANMLESNLTEREDNAAREGTLAPLYEMVGVLYHESMERLSAGTPEQQARAEQLDNIRKLLTLGFETLKKHYGLHYLQNMTDYHDMNKFIDNINGISGEEHDERLAQRARIHEEVRQVALKHAKLYAAHKENNLNKAPEISGNDSSDGSSDGSSDAGDNDAEDSPGDTSAASSMASSLNSDGDSSSSEEDSGSE